MRVALRLNQSPFGYADDLRFASCVAAAGRDGMMLRPHKIVFVITDLWGGGAEAMLTRLVTAEPRLADEITVLSLLHGGPHNEQLRAAGITVIEPASNAAPAVLRGVVRLVQHIARDKPDIVQGFMYHGDLAALVALILSGRRRSTRLAWSIRCSDMDFSRYSWRLRLAVKACALLSRWPDLITANSAAGLKAHLRLGYRPRRAEVVFNGIDTELFRPDPELRAALRRDLGLPTDACVVAHVARVDPMKDHACFLAAMDQLPDMHALLIGAGTEQLAEQPNVMRLGRRADVPRVLNAADFIASSSAFGEGFSNAIAEGMACGLPAVATDVGDARTIIGDTGLVVPPRDPEALAAAIAVLASEDAPARAARRQRAHDRIVENFALPRALEKFAALYASL